MKIRLETGDVGLTHSTSLSARLIQFLTHSYWNHAFVIVVLRQENGEDLPWIVEAGISPVMREFELAASDEMAIYRYPGLTLEQKRLMALVALSYPGRKIYDFFLPIRIFKRVGLVKGLRILYRMAIKGKDCYIPHISDDFVVCSELVQEMFSAVGYPLIPDEYLLAPGTIAKLRHTVLQRTYGLDID